MEVKNIICTLFFNRIESPRNKIEELENSKLSKYFMTPFNPQPVPIDAPPALPRITASSADGIYDLIISQIFVQLVRKVPFKYDNDLKAKLEETKNIVLDIFSNMKTIYNQDMLYFGTNCIIDINNNLDPVKQIKEKYIKDINDNVCEINLRYSSVDDEKYYNNIMCSNVKEYQIDIPIQKGQNNIIIDNISTSNMKEINHIIQFSIDIIQLFIVK